MSKFIERESYLHKFAKNLLANWLREEDLSNNDPCRLFQFQWRSNYGVFEELKFHETDDPCYFECSEAIKHNDSRNPLDWIDSTVDRGKILFVPDIVVFHKGSPKYIFEIVHTHAISNKKIMAISKFFGGHYVEVYEIFARDLLALTDKPKEIAARKIEI